MITLSIAIFALLYSACSAPVCGCEKNGIRFCKFDDGNTGICDSCFAFSTADACRNAGLPPKGVSDCIFRCFSTAHKSLTAHKLPKLEPPRSPFSVELCGKVTTLRMSQREKLRSKGYTKCCMSGFLGLVVAGTDNYPDTYLQWAANIAAGILDQNKNGVPDDPGVAKQLNTKLTHTPPLMVGGVDEKEESQGDEVGDGINFEYAFSLQTWKGMNGEIVKAIMTEEVFHMITMFGYPSQHPEQFGLSSWNSSVLTRECARAMCVTWHHPENICPQLGVHTNPPLEGTCNDPGCDCVEWFHQVALLLAGQEPGWRSDLLPANADELRSKLSKEFLEVMENPRYHQLKAPINWFRPTLNTFIEEKIF